MSAEREKIEKEKKKKSAAAGLSDFAFEPQSNWIYIYLPHKLSARGKATNDIKREEQRKKKPEGWLLYACVGKKIKRTRIRRCRIFSLEVVASRVVCVWIRSMR